MTVTTTAADILWEKYPEGCATSMRENGRVIVHPDMLKEAQCEADERNAKCQTKQ